MARRSSARFNCHRPSEPHTSATIPSSSNASKVSLLDEECCMSAIIPFYLGTLMRIFVIIAFIGILGSLGSALFYLMRDKGTSNKTVNALTVRIGISVALFLFLLFSHWMGWIETTGFQR
jgi:hypothetical protein